jgi:hypothetical protein
MVKNVKSKILQEWERKTGKRQYLENHLKYKMGHEKVALLRSID